MLVLSVTCPSCRWLTQTMIHLRLHQRHFTGPVSRVQRRVRTCIRHLTTVHERILRRLLVLLCCYQLAIHLTTCLQHWGSYSNSPHLGASSHQQQKGEKRRAIPDHLQARLLTGTSKATWFTFDILSRTCCRLPQRRTTNRVPARHGKLPKATPFTFGTSSGRGLLGDHVFVYWTGLLDKLSLPRLCSSWGRRSTPERRHTSSFSRPRLLLHLLQFTLLSRFREKNITNIGSKTQTILLL